MKRHVLFLGGFFAALAVLTALASRERRAGGGGPRLAGVSLAALDTGEVKDMGGCSTPRCLSVYVSPWCGVCRASTGLVKDLRGYLSGKGVETRVIVGRDSPGEVEGYAREFGQGTFLDPGGRFPLRGGVPNFIVSDGEGRVLRSVPGVPRVYHSPVSPEILQGFAESLGLFEAPADS